MRIAFVTPWPPQKSGIADYAFDLVSGILRHGHDVTVYTACAEPAPLPGVGFRPHTEAVTGRSRHDVIVYQMGNQPDLHGYMVESIRATGGVVHLHDYSIHSVFAVLRECGRESDYYACLRKWYGSKVEAACRRMIELWESPWTDPVVLHVPLCEEMLQHASACIVHSKLACSQIGWRLPELPVRTVAQLYPGETAAATNRAADPARPCRQIAILGFVNRTKLLDRALPVLSQVIGDDPIRVVIAGKVEDHCRHLVENTRCYPNADRFIWEDAVSMERFIELIHASDLVVSLRYPSMGEVSGVVMRCVQAGTPVVVSDTAWYSELPSFVSKISPANTESELAAEVGRFIHDDAFRTLKRTGSRAYADGLSYDRMVEEYLSVLAAASGATAEPIQEQQPSGSLLAEAVNRRLAPLLHPGAAS